MRDLSENIKAMANKLDIQFPTPLPLFLSPPNIEHLEDWAESQITPISRKIAHKMVENLQYITFEAFLKQLQKTINNFHQKVKDDPYVLLVGELRPDKLAEGCSDQWIIGLALEYCGLKEPEAILTPDQLKAWQDTYPTATKILMLDDAAYSGEQKIRILNYLNVHKSEINLSELSFYVGIPFMTHYAKNILSSRNSSFKELIVLEHVYMKSTVDILDAKEIFYAKQTNIGFISDRQTLTYFDHRFADFFSSFQQIYDGSNLLSGQSVCMMRFSGYTFESDLAKRNKNLQLMIEPDQYNELAISLTDPNGNCSSCFGYTIPRIFSPYKLHQYGDKEKLTRAIELGQVGVRSPYSAKDPEIVAILSKSVAEGMNFLGYEKTTLSIEKQMGYDKAVMLGNQNDITYVDQVDRHIKHQQLQHELKTCFPVLKPVQITSGHQYLRYLTDVFDMIAMALRILCTMIQETLSLDQHPVSTIRPN